jgi:hypothetical protein
MTGQLQKHCGARRGAAGKSYTGKLLELQFNRSALTGQNSIEV